MVRRQFVQSARRDVVAGAFATQFFRVERSAKPRFGNLEAYGFGQFVETCSLPDTYDTTIAYRRFSLGEEKTFIAYVGRELLTPGRLPGVTEGAKRRLEGYFHEIFNNAVIHSASNAGVFTCGQHFPHKERLDFTVTDLGLGFGEKVRGFLRKRATTIRALIGRCNRETPRALAMFPAVWASNACAISWRPMVARCISFREMAVG